MGRRIRAQRLECMRRTARGHRGSHAEGDSREPVCGHLAAQDAAALHARLSRASDLHGREGPLCAGTVCGQPACAGTVERRAQRDCQRGPEEVC